MDYQEWISRERRIRVRILKTSPTIRESRICRVCPSCREICLCHEMRCPNCDSANLVDDLVPNLDEELAHGKRIRCVSRFQALAAEEPGPYPSHS